MHTECAGAEHIRETYMGSTFSLRVCAAQLAAGKCEAGRTRTGQSGLASSKNSALWS